MLRAAFLALLMACLPPSVRAQRGVAGSASAGVGPAHSNFGSHSGAATSHHSGRGPQWSHARHHGRGWGAFPYFFADNETGWPQDDVAQGPAIEAPLVRVRDESREREPTTPLPAQVIEIANNEATAGRPLPATVFILANGERLETQRYLLTASSVSLTVHRDQRTISLQMIDLDATVAANRERGINLRIPNDRNEISIRF